MPPSKAKKERAKEEAREAKKAKKAKKDKAKAKEAPPTWYFDPSLSSKYQVSVWQDKLLESAGVSLKELPPVGLSAAMAARENTFVIVVENSATAGDLEVHGATRLNHTFVLEILKGKDWRKSVAVEEHVWRAPVALPSASSSSSSSSGSASSSTPSKRCRRERGNSDDETEKQDRNNDDDDDDDDEDGREGWDDGDFEDAPRESVGDSDGRELRDEGRSRPLFQGFRTEKLACQLSGAASNRVNHNEHITGPLQELADYYEMTQQAQDSWRPFAYNKVIKAIKNFPSKITMQNMHECRDQLNDLYKVGKQTVAKVEELVETGRLERLEDLRRRGELNKYDEVRLAHTS